MKRQATREMMLAASERAEQQNNVQRSLHGNGGAAAFAFAEHTLKPGMRCSVSVLMDYSAHCVRTLHPLSPSALLPLLALPSPSTI